MLHVNSLFMAPLVEHCSANGEATGSNPVEAPKIIFFLGLNSRLLIFRLQLRWSHLHFTGSPITREAGDYPSQCPPIWACTTQRGRDFGIPDLERDIPI